MNTVPQPDSLHRLVKHAMDSGRAQSVAEAEAIFRGYRLAVEIGPAAAEDPVNQATLVTVVALAKRVFLGGVSVTGSLGAGLSTPLPLGRKLATAVKALGVRIGVAAPGTPTIVIGGGPSGRREGFSIRTAAAGWRGGILPIHSNLAPVPGPAMPLAGMLSAALAVNEAYLHTDGGMSIAGRRALGLSLWQPEAHTDWLAGDSEEPPLTYLPSRLWLIGLGHLGQAYLWGLGILPYRDPRNLSLVLQDVDVITDSTESTSVLTHAELVGEMKTRAMAAWADARGFETAIYERLFDADFQRQQSEPGVALCGLDKASYRRALDQVGFDMVIEAGLGSGYRDFRTMRLHTLPGPRPAAQIWNRAARTETVEDRPAYKRLLREGTLDQCGMTMLAGKAVGAPFVGAVAATLVLSEILRHLHGGWVHQMIDLDLLGLDQRLALRHEQGFDGLNPGFAEAKWPIPAANAQGGLGP